MTRQVFISYRHESPEHARAVKRLGELLRSAGLPVWLDQFYLDEYPGGPNEGWPKWCDDAANHSAAVLIISSPGWFAAYDKTAPAGVGLGAASEADIFRQTIYDQQGRNAHIRLVTLPGMEAVEIPSRLKPWHRFAPFQCDADLDGLTRWCGQRLGLDNIQSPLVAWPMPRDHQPDLADRTEQEWPAIRELLAGRARQRILMYQGGSGLGKTLLLNEAQRYARALGIPTVRVDLKASGLNAEFIHDQFDLELSNLLPNFSAASRKTVQTLRKDLRALRRPVLVMFDSYEAIAGNTPLEEWLGLHFLPEVETALGLVVIVAGQRLPEVQHATWRDQTRCLSLKPITEAEHWQHWLARRHPGTAGWGTHLPTLLLATQGMPSTMATLCANIAGAQA